MQNAILECLGRDSRLQPLLASLPFPSVSSASSDLFLDLLRSIIGQQLSVKAAQTIYERFLGLFPRESADAGYLLSLSDDTLRQIGLSRQKINYVRNVAVFFAGIQTDPPPWERYEDETIIQVLTEIKGVGVWTVQMLLMFSLNRPDVFPVADLGIQTAMRRLYGLDSQGKVLHSEMTAIAESWRPYRSYACFYLWNWKDLPGK
jgi:DNA-3-methyladenine glycosylase II